MLTKADLLGLAVTSREMYAFLLQKQFRALLIQKVEGMLAHEKLVISNC